MTPPQPLEAFRDRHAGAEVIVCGCGASLTGFTPPPGAITIGVNDMGRAFDPDYLVVLNALRTFDADRRGFIRRTRARAVFSHLDLAVPDLPLVRFRLGRLAGVDPPQSGTLHYARNSPYAAVHLAALMGARRIGLIGVDFTQDHFFGATGTHPLAQSLPRIDAEYGALAKALAARGVTLDNLSPSSRLTTLPRRAGRKAAPLPKPPASPRRIAIARHRAGVIGDLMDALAASAVSLGHTVHRGGPGTAHPETVAVTWNGRSLRWRGPVLYCEHGWLPRSAYQISPKGINADSHIAPFAWNGQPLDPATAQEIRSTLEILRRDAVASRSGTAPDAPFYLVPLQMEYDTNLVRHAPRGLRQMQALIDTVSAANPPLPMVFKQHPADLKRGNRHLALRLRRKQDQLWPHHRGCVHMLLSLGNCAGILSINSNVVHDGLIHDVPAVVLGQNLWPPVAPGPFLTALPKDWNSLKRHHADPQTALCRSAYAHHLLRHQWSLADARDPAKVQALLDSLPRRSAQPVRPTPPARPLRAPVTPRANRPGQGPRINIFARNKGWVFEEIKTQLAARARARGLAVTATERPDPRASAWIAIRAAEAALSPDPARTLVQIHDRASPETYLMGGKRHGVLRAGKIQILHPSFADDLRGCNGFDPGRLLPCLPVGASSAARMADPARPGFSVGWFGRPEQHEGRERHRPDLFVCALCGLGLEVSAVLVGSRLEPYADILRLAGVSTKLLTAHTTPLARWPRIAAQLDVLVQTSDTGPGSIMLFEALAAGVPVIAPEQGWARDLLADPVMGRFASTPGAIETILRQMRHETAIWRAGAKARRNAMQHYRRDAWLDQTLDAAGVPASGGQVDCQSVSRNT